MSIGVQQPVINGHSCGPWCSMCSHAFVCVLCVALVFVFAHPSPKCVTTFSWIQSLISYSRAVVFFVIFSPHLSFSVLLFIDHTTKKGECLPQQLFCVRECFGDEGRTVYSALKKRKKKNAQGGYFHFISDLVCTHMCLSTNPSLFRFSFQDAM